MSLAATLAYDGVIDPEIDHAVVLAKFEAALRKFFENNGLYPVAGLG